MIHPDDAFAATQRCRFTRENAHLYVRHDAKLTMQPTGCILLIRETINRPGVALTELLEKNPSADEIDMLWNTAGSDYILGFGLHEKRNVLTMIRDMARSAQAVMHGKDVAASAADPKVRRSDLTPSARARPRSPRTARAGPAPPACAPTCAARA
jgi:hypothetical protein